MTNTLQQNPLREHTDLDDASLAELLDELETRLMRTHDIEFIDSARLHSIARLIREHARV